MDLHLVPGRRGQLGASLYRQLRSAILSGHLAGGARLPSTRELSRQLDVGRNTVLAVYEQLSADGLLESSGRGGTSVRAGLVATPGRSRSTSRLRALPEWSALAATVHELPRAPFDFRVGVPDPDLFPWRQWKALVGRQLQARRRPVGYGPAGGEPALREAIARHLAMARGLRVSADEVVITAGAQQAIALVTRALVRPGATVALEDPGYSQARRVFAAQGAKLVGVPVDAEGLEVAKLPRCALVYVTPSHQFPLGVVLSHQRRTALLERARSLGAAILEDDYDSEFRFDGRPLDPLQTLDADGRVLYVGSFSKTMYPGLRLGFVVAPRPLARVLERLRALSDAFGSPELQRALAVFIERGDFARHVRRLQRVYVERRDALYEALERHLPGARPWPSVAGLHVAVSTPRGVPRVDGVSFERLEAFTLRRSMKGLVLGYGLISAERVDEGVRQLATALARRR